MSENKEKATNSRLKSFFKLSFVVISIFGFVLQTTDLFMQFSSRQTVVKSTLKTVHFDSIPAITICYPRFLSMESVAQKYPQTKQLYEDYKTLLSNGSEIETTNKTLLDYLDGKSLNTLIEEQNLTMDELFQLSIPYIHGVSIRIYIHGAIQYPNGTIEDIVLFDSILDKNPVESVMFFSSEATPKCFTFKTHVNQDIRDYKVNIEKTLIFIYQNASWVPSVKNETSKISFAIHSPRFIPNYLSGNFKDLEMSKSHEISYNQLKTILLEAPYQTNCKNYNTDDNQEFRLRSDCVNRCILDKLTQKFNKLNFKNETKNCLLRTDMFWNKDSFKNLQDIRLCSLAGSNHNGLALLHAKENSMCEDECQPDCIKHFYNYETKIIGEDKQKNKTFIFIKHNQMPDQIIEHLPEMTFILLAGNFGGLLGLWLGLSALAILHFFLDAIHCFNSTDT